MEGNGRDRHDALVRKTAGCSRSLHQSRWGVYVQDGRLEARFASVSHNDKARSSNMLTPGGPLLVAILRKSVSPALWSLLRHVQPRIASESLDQESGKRSAWASRCASWRQVLRVSSPKIQWFLGTTTLLLPLSRSVVLPSHMYKSPVTVMFSSTCLFHFYDILGPAS